MEKSPLLLTVTFADNRDLSIPFHSTRDDGVIIYLIRALCHFDQAKRTEKSPQVMNANNIHISRSLGKLEMTEWLSFS